MSFLRADLMRPVPSGLSVGGHLLQVGAVRGSSVPWSLRCAGCLAELAAGHVASDGPLLAGAQNTPAVGDRPPMTWAWGATPVDPAAGPATAEVVFVRGVLRQPAVAVAHPLESGVWVAAAPGRARSVIAVAPGRAVHCSPERLAVPACPDPTAGTRR